MGVENLVRQLPLPEDNQRPTAQRHALRRPRDERERARPDRREAPPAGVDDVEADACVALATMVGPGVEAWERKPALADPGRFALRAVGRIVGAGVVRRARVVPPWCGQPQ